MAYSLLEFGLSSSKEETKSSWLCVYNLVQSLHADIKGADEKRGNCYLAIKSGLITLERGVCHVFVVEPRRRVLLGG